MFGSTILIFQSGGYVMPNDNTPAVTNLAATTTPSKKPRRLVVLVPGFNGYSSKWKDLRVRLDQEREFVGAEWLEFNHHTRRRVFGSLEQLAQQLDGLISAYWIEKGGFDEVILVGHSIGGLIVRQTYLLAMGAVQETQQSVWAYRVVRIVLMASVNRGLDLSRNFWYRAAAWLIRNVPFLPHLYVEDMLRGSTMLTNLRINWIRFFGNLEDKKNQATWPDGSQRQSPVVVQILGDDDKTVLQEDSKDVLAFPNGHYLPVPYADHDSVFRLDLAENPEQRYAVLKKGFLGVFSNEQKNVQPNLIGKVVFLLHGIRASNVDQWIRELEGLITSRGVGLIEVRSPTYGYFTAAKFVLPAIRRKNIRDFQDWYTEALAEHPNAEFDIIAHSHGSYILGQSLKVTPGMRFKNVALAGSVLPINFPWDTLVSQGQIENLRNERADRDWPVALLCNGLRGLRMHDVGTGGFAGFNGQSTHEVAYHPGDHGSALANKNQALLVNFILNGTAQDPGWLNGSPGLYRQLSNFMPYLALSIAFFILLGAGYWIYTGQVVIVLGMILILVVIVIILDII
jgi:pimeloyl-ACP methyl ester carboxylesterase